jgi:hypothetical protein
MIYHMMSRPDESRYWDEVARAERREMQLRTDTAGRATVRATGVCATPVERTTPAPVLEWNDDHLRERDADRLRADDEFWDWYKGTLEARGKCLCPNCHAKVEKFGQYCQNCTF